MKSLLAGSRFASFADRGRTPVEENGSTEEFIESYLGRFLRQANRELRARAIGDISLALSLLLAGGVIGLPESPLPGLILLPAALLFSFFRLKRLRRAVLNEEKTVLHLEGKLGLEQRLVTFQDYSRRTERPLLYPLLAAETAAKLKEYGAGKAGSRGWPLSAYLAAIPLIILLIFLANRHVSPLFPESIIKTARAAMKETGRREGEEIAAAIRDKNKKLCADKCLKQERESKCEADKKLNCSAKEETKGKIEPKKTVNCSGRACRKPASGNSESVCEKPPNPDGQGNDSGRDCQKAGSDNCKSVCEKSPGAAEQGNMPGNRKAGENVSLPLQKGIQPLTPTLSPFSRGEEKRVRSSPPSETEELRETGNKKDNGEAKNSCERTSGGGSQTCVSGKKKTGETCKRKDKGESVCQKPPIVPDQGNMPGNQKVGGAGKEKGETGQNANEKCQTGKCQRPGEQPGSLSGAGSQGGGPVYGPLEQPRPRSGSELRLLLEAAGPAEERVEEKPTPLPGGRGSGISEADSRPATEPQNPEDIPEQENEAAIDLTAIPVEYKEIVRRIQLKQ